MSSESLAEKLQYTKAYRQTRLDLAHWVIARPNTISELIQYCFQTHEDISYKATWILEFVCTEQLELLFPHLDFYFENLPKVYKDQALRPLAKICEMIATSYYKTKNPATLARITSAHKAQMTECCFDWLITEQKVACKVYAMTTLCYLGTEFDWIHPELRTTIEQNIHDALPAYRARGKYVLKQINKFQKK